MPKIYSRKLPPDSAVLIPSIILLGVVVWLIISFSLKYLIPESAAFLDSLLAPTFLVVMIITIIAVIIAYSINKRRKSQ